MSEELTKTKLLPIQGKDMDSIMQNLETGVAELFTSERYQEYLKTMSKFHNYSFNNTLLIAMQRPDATLVTGYRNCDHESEWGYESIFCGSLWIPGTSGFCRREKKDTRNGK